MQAVELSHTIYHLNIGLSETLAHKNVFLKIGAGQLIIFNLIQNYF
jgi:hypothetical protein